MDEKKPEDNTVKAPEPVVPPPVVAAAALADPKKPAAKGAKAPEPVPVVEEVEPVLEEEVIPTPVDFKADSPIDPEGRIILEVYLIHFINLYKSLIYSSLYWTYI